MIPYEPYLIECPGLSALPSPPTVRGPLDTHSDRIVAAPYSTHTIVHMPDTIFDDQKRSFL